MDEFEEQYPDDLDIDAPEPSKKEIHRYIEQLLPAYRPNERYANADKTWMEPVFKLAYDEAKRYELTRDGLLRDWIRNSVLKQERNAARVTDNLMRKIGSEGRLPLGWGEGDEWKKSLGLYLRSPLRLLSDQRVPFGVAALTDFDEWDTARDEKFKRVRAAHDEGKQGFRVIKDLFEGQPKARRADQLSQPDEDEAE